MISLPSYKEGEPLTLGRNSRRGPQLLALGVMAIYIAMSVTVLATHDWDPKAFILERPEDIPALVKHFVCHFRSDAVVQSAD